MFSKQYLCINSAADDIYQLIQKEGKNEEPRRHLQSLNVQNISGIREILLYLGKCTSYLQSPIWTTNAWSGSLCEGGVTEFPKSLNVPDSSLSYLYCNIPHSPYCSES